MDEGSNLVDGVAAAADHGLLTGLGGELSEGGVVPELFDVTVVIPTRNEAGNVDELLSRLQGALGAIRAEVIFVDDSDDGTPEVIRAAVGRFSLTVRLLHRAPGDRTGRLGGAVAEGFRAARAPWAVVIDGDLQHPPEVLPFMLSQGLAQEVDLVYGSRYAKAGNAGGLSSRTREWVSRFSTVLAKAVFPHKLRGVSDPMSGFFAVRLATLNLSALQPSGFKVLLEILAQSRLRQTVEVPFSFQPRFSGNSKASLAEGFRFLVQLVALRLGMSVVRLHQLVAFLAVGLVGMVVNTFILWELTDSFSVPYLPASAIATNVAIAGNFLLLRIYVFKRPWNTSYRAGFARFWLLNLALLPAQLVLLALLVENMNLWPVLANIGVLCVVFVARFLFTAKWVFGAGMSEAAAPVVMTPGVRGRLHSSAAVLLRPRGRDGRFGGAAPGGVRYRSTIQQGGLVLRMLVPVVATLVAVPVAAVRASELLRAGGSATVGLIIVVTAALVLAAVRMNPSPREPDVHDRQLDVILGLPILLAAVWLSLGWGNGFAPTVPWGPRGVVVVETILVGSSFLVLGTRLTARLRWVWCCPLLALPVVTSRPVLSWLLIAVVVGAAAMSVAVRQRHRAAVSSEHWSATRQSQQLPPWRLAATTIIAVAGLLAFLSVTQPQPASASAPATHQTP